MRNSKFSKVLSVVVSAAVVVGAIGAVFFRQQIYDTWRLRGYAPSAEIVALAADTTMTDEAEHIFYVTHPSVTDAATFNENCHIEEFSIVLGCYISNGNIYVFDVTDKRLNGIHEVTAAHEMLHAAYERLGSEDRARIDTLLVDTFKQLHDTRLNSTIAQYQSNDPASVPNELHSILGTEVRDLPRELEDHYKQYFSNRQKVVEYSEKYEKVFSSRETRVQLIDKKLDALKVDIDFNKEILNEDNQTLGASRQELDSLRANGRISEYNSKVDEYNQLVNEYNTLVESTKVQISEYNTLVKERNSLVVEVQDLVHAIDSTPEEIR